MITTKSLQAEGKCGKMLHTRGFGLGHGPAYCGNKMPCELHPKDGSLLKEISRTIQYCLSVDGFRMSAEVKEKLQGLIPILDGMGKK